MDRHFDMPSECMTSSVMLCNVMWCRTWLAIVWAVIGTLCNTNTFLHAIKHGHCLRSWYVIITGHAVWILMKGTWPFDLVCRTEADKKSFELQLWGYIHNGYGLRMWKLECLNKGSVNLSNLDQFNGWYKSSLLCTAPQAAINIALMIFSQFSHRTVVKLKSTL